MKPLSECPFINQYKNNYQVAYICKKDCMNPQIYYEDYEENMPWD